MTERKFARVSEAYDALKEHGFDARGIDNNDDLVRGFQPLRAQYKDQGDGRAEVYDDVLRPAFVAVANAIKKVHPKLHRDESTQVLTHETDEEL
jgi:hypothetical protein